MVEFGLKLRDNKVEEWADYYVRYEKLKQILKKYKSQIKNFNDLAKKDTELSNGLKEAWLEGTLLTTPATSSENLQKFTQSPLPSSPKSPQAKPPTRVEATLSPGVSPSTSSPLAQIREEPIKTSDESTKLLLEKSDRQDKNSSYGSGRSVEATITSAFFRATSGVTDYFKYPLERQLKDALKPLEKSSVEFEVVLHEDIDMVNAFYNDKLKESEERLGFLKETVAASHKKTRHLHHKASSSDDGVGADDHHHHSQRSNVGDEETQLEDDIATPLIPARHRRTQSPLDLAKSLVRFSRRVSAGGDFLTNPGGLHNSQQQHHSKAEGGRHTSFGASMAIVDHDDIHDDDAKGEGEDEESFERIREAESIQRAIVDQYRTAKLLHNYAIMNYTAFVKIVKKHDKINPDQKGKYKNAIRPSQICDEGKAVEALAQRLEYYYAIWFCGGNRSEACAQMLPKKGDGLEMDWGQLRLGYRLGMCTILGLWVCWDCIWGVVAEHSTTIGERTAFPVFRACGGLLTLQWFWGMSTWVWSRYRINYIYLFDFDPRIVSSPLSIFNSAVDNTLVFLICMLLYYKAGAHDMPGDDIPAGVFPFLLVMYTILQLILPLRTRIPMWLSIWRLVTAPISSPSFYDGYVGDIFTSLVKVFQDMAWTTCWILAGDFMIPEDSPASGKFRWSKSFAYRHVAIPLLTLLPLWFRFNQCLRRYADTGDRFPHLANAFKYALSQTVTLFGAFHPLYMDLSRHRESSMFQLFWMFAFIGSSLYSFAWDVFMDWGLGKPKYNFLGPRLMYPRKGAYYAIIGLDLVLRFAWVLTLIPPDTGAHFALPHYLTAVSMVLELYRRTVWGFLRLENEHRSNTQGYRRVGFVPLHFSTGHKHEYKEEKEHRGFSVLLEVAIITCMVVGVSFGSVIAAQHATERANERAATDDL
eukprot:CAMPEP_0172440198 /NCGR_PEP_ID=MMETSP1065-20121228/911_1 /TAXON_ID=265537 /ORGANISM="Amphiprora paludosa, Strain CCMP125" /LENGTH=924 /DNA_ID=CAMNT_0013188983 /DNA_START=235 /DNA_END=3009 /DNA_ORIENTATION=-